MKILYFFIERIGNDSEHEIQQSFIVKEIALGTIEQTCLPGL